MLLSWIPEDGDTQLSQKEEASGEGVVIQVNLRTTEVGCSPARFYAETDLLVFGVLQGFHYDIFRCLCMQWVFKRFKGITRVAPDITDSVSESHSAPLSLDDASAV